MVSKINQNNPTNACGEKLYFWLTGNVTQANTLVNGNFDIIKEEEKNSQEKMLTWFDWRKNYEQKTGYVEINNLNGVNPYDYYDSFLLFPDGSVPFQTKEFERTYNGAKFIPLNEEEMKYIKSKTLVPIDAENLVENRWIYFHIAHVLLCAYYMNIKTKKLIYWQLNDNQYSVSENAFAIDPGMRGIEILLSNDLVPATNKDLMEIKKRAETEEKRTIQVCKVRKFNMPPLITDICKKKREFYLQDQNQPE